MILATREAGAVLFVQHEAFLALDGQGVVQVYPFLGIAAAGPLSLLVDENLPPYCVRHSPQSFAVLEQLIRQCRRNQVRVRHGVGWCVPLIHFR